MDAGRERTAKTPAETVNGWGHEALGVEIRRARDASLT
jgi:hypothetical protein